MALFPSLETLRVFEVACRHGSYSEAARELHVTHSAVSQRIRQLEEELALQLPFLKVSESMGNHDSNIVDAGSVDRRDACVVGGVAW